MSIKLQVFAFLAILDATSAVSDTRLLVVNGCSSAKLWIAHIVNGKVGPDTQDVMISPGGQASFHTSVNGVPLTATRFWPKMGCDPSGGHCAIGDSGGPGELCNSDGNYSACSPPVDTKFEATFAAPGGAEMDTVDMSLVDGYTLPFKLETTGGTCTRKQIPFQKMDCSGLSLSSCPKAESLNGGSADLHAVNPTTKKNAGCYSPCMKLTDNKWNKAPVAPDSSAAGPYCCAGNYGNPGECNAGPILRTDYLKTVRDACTGAYGYAYDDKVATIVCTTSTEYKLTFYCPADETLILL